jgi:P pilus assembly chaperone PapD
MDGKMRSSNSSPPRKSVNAAGSILFIWIFLFFAALDLSAGVLVAPTVVVLSDKKRTGRLNIENPTDKPTEITVSFSFGLPISDSLGNVHITLQDSNVTDPRSAMGWVKAFPRKVIIPPRGSQVVRVVARPPKGLADGEYWARIVVRSEEGETTLPPAGGDGQITTKLNMIMRTAVMLKYRTGDQVAQLELVRAETRQTDSLVEVMLDLANRGNASYLAVLRCRLLDADNRQISYRKIDIAVYRDLRRRVDLPIIEGDFKKPYEVELSINSRERKDIPREDMIYGNDINWSMVIE